GSVLIRAIRGQNLLQNCLQTIAIRPGAFSLSGVTPARTVIVAQTLGTYMRVSDGSAAAIPAKVFTSRDFRRRWTRPSPALYAAKASGHSPNFACRVRR